MDILNQFGINPILLAAQVVNFLILLFILKKFLYKPLLKVLEARKKTIADSLKNAEEIEQRLLKITEDEEKRMQQLTLEAEKIIKEAQLSATQLTEEGKKHAEGLAKKILDDAQNQLQLEREKLRQEVRGELATFVAIALEKITGKVITKKEQKDMIKREVQNLS